MENHSSVAQLKKGREEERREEREKRDGEREEGRKGQEEERALTVSMRKAAITKPPKFIPAYISTALRPLHTHPQCGMPSTALVTLYTHTYHDFPVLHQFDDVLL